MWSPLITNVFKYSKEYEGFVRVIIAYSMTPDIFLIIKGTLEDSQLLIARVPEPE